MCSQCHLFVGKIVYPNFSFLTNATEPFTAFSETEPDHGAAGLGTGEEAD